MDKESNFGNIEYKRFIKYNNNNNKKNRKDSLISQLKFRLKEGNGTCIYNIGVEELPKISIYDAAIVDLGLSPGDVVKITRDSETAGKSIFYRVVIEIK